MRLTLAPEELLLAAPARDAAEPAAAPLRRSGDRLHPARPADTGTARPRPVHFAPGGHAARQLRRALAEYHARSESA